MPSFMESIVKFPSRCITAVGRFLFWTSAITAVVATRGALFPGNARTESSDFLKLNTTDDTLAFDPDPHVYGSYKSLGILNEQNFQRMTEAEFLANAMKLSEAGVPLERSTKDSNIYGIKGQFHVADDQGPLVTYHLIRDIQYTGSKITGGKIEAAEYSQDITLKDKIMRTVCYFKPKEAMKGCLIAETNKPEVRVINSK